MANLLTKFSTEIEELKKNQNIQSIILFGSYSTGKIKPLSDLDICIITTKKATKKAKTEILSNGTDEFDLSLFENLPLSLQFKILTTGKILHTTKDLSQLKRITMNQWFDFRPIINRLYQSRGYPQIKI
ncbi:MAG: nucleotidyltransferase domain-containing protein [Nanoarchaeales archaeon]|nr:nucleotidyltransferase domain-containing protein [Nanoarchaeales archaeon]